MTGRPKIEPLTEGHVVKGGVNKWPSQIRVRPADPAPLHPAAATQPTQAGQPPGPPKEWTK